MMAMTPHESKTLEEIERAFLESVEPRFSPVAPTTLKITKARCAKPTKASGGWFSNMKERLVMKFVCCAAPQELLDDDEIQEILAAMEEPTVKAGKPELLTPLRGASRKDTLLRRSSASVMPVSHASVADRAAPVIESPEPLSDITSMLQKPTAPPLSPSTTQEPALVECEPSVELALSDISTSPVSPARPLIKLSTVQLTLSALLSLQNLIHARQTARVALSIQQRWRRRQQATAPFSTPVSVPVPASAPVLLLPAPVSTPAPTPVICTPEPDREPESISSPPARVSSPKRLRLHRHRTHRLRHKKTKFDVIQATATAEATEAIESLNQLAMTRKRLRSVDLESRFDAIPLVDVERNVPHVLFGDEQIDDDDEDEDDEDEELALELLTPFCLSASHAAAMFPIQRCASVPPPMTAVRPQPIKSKALIQTQAVVIVQRAWRAYKLRVERAIQRRLAQYEREKQSVMPTIRSKMAQLRKRLEEMQLQHHEITTLTTTTTTSNKNYDDDFDWL